jgi:GGDEF domain-containing protein
MLLLTDWFFHDYRIYFWGNTPTAGIALYFFMAFYLGLYLWTNFLLYAHYREAKKTSPLKYSQIRYLFCTFGLLPLGFIDFLSMSGIDFFPSGYLFTLLGLILIAITLLRYRLVEIDIVVSKFVFFFFTGLLLALSFLALTGILTTIVNYRAASIFASVLIITIIFFTALKDKIEHISDLLILRNKYEYQKALNETTQLLITKLDLSELCYFLINMLAKNIGMLKASLLMENEEGNYYIRMGYALEQGLTQQYIIHKNSNVVAWLKENRSIFIKEEMEQVLSKHNFREIYGDLYRISAEVIIPLFYRGNLTGIICLDNKRSGAIYNQADIDILETLAGQAAIALEKAKLYTEAVTDSLTKLYYHRYFQRRLDEDMDRARRYSHHLSLVLIDIDSLKLINESCSREEGDHIIMEVASVIKGNTRLTDVPARYSGHEFAIILPETREEGAFNVAQRIKENVTRAIEIAEHIRREIEKHKLELTAGTKVEITVSIGVGNFNGMEGRVTTEEMIEMARKALSKAKKLGGNRVVVYNPELSSK